MNRCVPSVTASHEVPPDGIGGRVRLIDDPVESDLRQVKEGTARLVFAAVRVEVHVAARLVHAVT